MISLDDYRRSIGCYNPRTRRCRRERADSFIIHAYLGTGNSIFMESAFFLYLYIMVCFILLVGIILMDIPILDDMMTVPSNFTLDYKNFGLPCLSTIYVRLAYFAIITFGLNRAVRGNLPLCKCNSISSVFFGQNTSKIKNLITYLLLFIMLIGFLMIAIVNTSLLNPGPQNLKIFFHNVQGLVPFSYLKDNNPILNRTKLLELKTYMYSEKPDLVILNETWLKKSIHDGEIFDNNLYDIYRKDRSKLSHPVDENNPGKYRENGGGVLIAVRSDLEVTHKRISLQNGAEILAIEISIGESKCVFCTCYRVGNLGISNHKIIRESIYRFYKSKKPKKIFIIGDFNLSSIVWSSDCQTEHTDSIENSFFETFHEFGLVQHISGATHIKGKTLDILLSSHSNLIKDIKVLEHNSVCKSDHLPIVFEIKTKVRRKKPTKRKSYNFKRANWEALNRDFSRVDWGAWLDSTDIDLAWKNFKSIFSHFVNKHIQPLTIKSEFQPPWFDSELFQACRKKERARQKFKHSGCMLDEVKFIDSRREFKSLGAQKMRDNMYNSDDPAIITKTFWSHHKFATNTHRIPDRMHLGSTFRDTSLDKANLFNKYFCDQFSETSSYDVPIDFSNDAHFDIDFSPCNVSLMLLRINSNKASGPDGIHGKILKKCASSLTHPLSILFKLSYNTGSLPKEWKLAHVVPIHKKGSKENVENYRPISLTSLVMKSFERIVKDKLISQTSHLLDDRQHGFLSKKSCTTNMVNFCDSLAVSLNDCVQTDVIYFDFAKAFDSVNHDLILLKLKHLFNIDGRLLKFVKEYLRDREQRVLIGNCVSDCKPVLSGVPQGSILGPILFVLFINDLLRGLSPRTCSALYADDTKIWRRIITEDDIRILQNDITHLNNWALQNKMKFHASKCKVVSVAHRPHLLLGILPFIQYHYNLGGKTLDYADSEKDLGVEINCKLNFTDQCTRIYNKANSQFGITRRTCYFVNDVKRKRILYLALIRSQFEHCSPIWRPTRNANKTMLDKLESLQKKCIKWILSEEYLSYSDHNTYIQKCRQVNLLPLEKRFDFNDLVLFYKIVYNLIPTKLPDYLSFFDGNTRLRSCHLDNLCLVSNISPNSTTFSGLNSRSSLYKSFFYRTHLLWNQLPLNIRNLNSLSEFKSELTSYLWKSIMDDEESSSDEDDAADTYLAT